MEKQIYDKLIEILNSILQPNKFTIEDKNLKLSTVGMSSLKLVEIVVEIEQAFHIEDAFDDEIDNYQFIGQIDTMEEMAQVVQDALQ